jgi:hypothetical protein
LPEIGRHRRPVKTDNRLHAWEWIVAPDGNVWKTDAIEHHRGHDLIGAQDIAWDVAGAAVELQLLDPDVERLVRVLRDRTAYHLRMDTFDFYKLCYLAFHFGYYWLAAENCRSSEPEEAARLSQAADRYRALLRHTLCPA